MMSRRKHYVSSFLERGLGQKCRSFPGQSTMPTPA
jgi:hypothetical protein